MQWYRYWHGIFAVKVAWKLVIVCKLLPQSDRETNTYKLTRRVINDVLILEKLLGGELLLFDDLKLMIPHMKYDAKYRNLINVSNEYHGVGSLLSTDIRMCLQTISLLMDLRLWSLKCIHITYKNKFNSYLTQTVPASL
jgi:hypothetical protein